MGAVVLDANIVIAFLAPTNVLHAVSVERMTQLLLPGSILLMPVSVYAEILVAPMRRGTSESMDAFLEEARIELVPIGRSIAREAAALRAQYTSLHLPDVLVWATARVQGAELATLDDRLQRLVEREPR